MRSVCVCVCMSVHASVFVCGVGRCVCVYGYVCICLRVHASVCVHVCVRSW